MSCSRSSLDALFLLLLECLVDCVHPLLVLHQHFLPVQLRADGGGAAESDRIPSLNSNPSQLPARKGKGVPPAVPPASGGACLPHPPSLPVVPPAARPKGGQISRTRIFCRITSYTCLSSGPIAFHSAAACRNRSLCSALAHGRTGPSAIGRRQQSGSGLERQGHR